MTRALPKMKKESKTIAINEGSELNGELRESLCNNTRSDAKSSRDDLHANKVPTLAIAKIDKKTGAMHEVRINTVPVVYDQLVSRPPDKGHCDATESRDMGSEPSDEEPDVKPKFSENLEVSPYRIYPTHRGALRTLAQFQHEFWILENIWSGEIRDDRHSIGRT
ncbi:hypothetical protein QFC20_004593 [Naganishia adeliensis]|uniref:Uncharacterized protein n=1 Tax=Naganishia adeliensis TaxID=92952 RepID=A0ACC2VZT9_9TREE|nr:hypothetical protein QFC20_004593 [Naganishia adeliensis]